MPNLPEPLDAEAEPSAAVSAVHRVLIAAAATATLGSHIRIREIRPVAAQSHDSWAKGRMPIQVARAVIRPQIKVRLAPARKAKKREIADHA